MTEGPADNPLADAGDRVGATWPNISKAREAADATLARLEEILGDVTIPSDTGLLAFGSIARGECTVGSDVDWTLLVDGPADPGHLRVAQDIDQRLKDADMKPPGPTGVFGGLAFSHDIVHQIGGDPDTNRNITRRILLLLESTSLGSPASGQPDDVRDRVIRLVLGRYLEGDLSLLTAPDDTPRIPRFLLNDIVRFWRTMAVDFAWKLRERGEKGWATRVLKLRFSRKLIFVAGLLLCFDCVLDPPATHMVTTATGVSRAPLIEHLRNYSDRPPLHVLASAALRYLKDDTIRQLFDAYDAFLGLLADADKRKHLDELSPSQAAADEVFQEGRDATHAFESALLGLFFRSDEKFANLSMRYGLF